MDRSVMAEVVFQDRMHAEQAVLQFNGADADGQIIHAEVTKLQQIPSLMAGGGGYMSGLSGSVTATSGDSTAARGSAITAGSSVVVGATAQPQSWEG